MTFLPNKIETLKSKELVLTLFSYLLVSIAIHHRLWQGEIPIGEDSRHHYLWIQNFASQLLQGDLYPRWLADTNYRYGSPTFVFYPPFTYYISAILKALGISFDRLLAILFTGITLSSGFFGYLCKRRDWGMLPAITIGLFFLFSPYQLVSLYERGALAESMAISLIPLGLWLTGDVANNPRHQFFLVLVSAMLALTHLPSLLLISIFWIPYIFAIHHWRSVKRISLAILAVILGWGIASFYLLPAMLEKSWVSVDNLKAVSGGYRANLFWSSKLSSVASSIFQLWKDESITFLFCLFSAAILCIFNSKKRRDLVLLILAYGAISFLMTDLSRPIWAEIEVLQNVQFPWRLMGLLSAVTALSTGFLISTTTSRVARSFFIVCLCIILVLAIRDTKRLVTNAPTLQQPRWYLDEPKFVAKLEKTRIAVDQPLAGLREDVPEYRPKVSGSERYEPKLGMPAVMIDRGKVEIESWKVRTRIVNTVSTDDSIVTFRIYDYPAWNLYLEGEPVPIERSPEGTISAQVPAGEHRLELKYEWTIAMYAGTLISLICLALVTVLYIVPNI